MNEVLQIPLSVMSKTRLFFYIYSKLFFFPNLSLVLNIFIPAAISINLDVCYRREKEANLQTNPVSLYHNLQQLYRYMASLLLFLISYSNIILSLVFNSEKPQICPFPPSVVLALSLSSMLFSDYLHGCGDH